MDNEEAYEDNYYRNRPFKEVVKNDLLTSEWWFKVHSRALGAARYSFGHNDPQIVHALIAKAETKAALRVAIKDNGLIDIIDFTLPSFQGKLRKNMAQKDAPAWVIRAICTLRIAREGSYIDGLGLKVSDDLYYLEPQESEEESDDLEQRKESEQ